MMIKISFNLMSIEQAWITLMFKGRPASEHHHQQGYSNMDEARGEEATGALRRFIVLLSEVFIREMIVFPVFVFPTTQTN